MEMVLKERASLQKRKLSLKKEIQAPTLKSEEIKQYLFMLESDTTITNFLYYDSCFRLADNYLLALVFVYFKRAGLNSHDFTFTNFFAGLLLAHAMVEEDDGFVAEILQWALPNVAENSSLVSQLETVKFLMFQAMGFRGYVSTSCCDKVMSMVDHPLWQRQRDALHGGATTESCKDMSDQMSSESYDWCTCSCINCRTAKTILLA